MKLFDLHNDVLTGSNNPFGYIKNLLSDYTVCTAVYKGNLSASNFINICEKFTNENFSNAKLCFEDVGYNELSIEDIIKYNPLYVQLTYNDENKYGFGCNFNENLKPLGVLAVNKLNLNGICIDVSHLSEKSALQVTEIADSVICSHTLLKSVYNHKRNICDDVVKNIIEKNGVVGLCLVGYFVDDAFNLNGFLKNVDYFIGKFGCDNLCIGSDFYGSDYYIGNINCYDKIYELYNALILRGYGKNDIDKIFYKNAARFFKILQKNGKRPSKN